MTCTNPTTNFEDSTRKIACWQIKYMNKLCWAVVQPTVIIDVRTLCVITSPPRPPHTHTIFFVILDFVMNGLKILERFWQSEEN